MRRGRLGPPRRTVLARLLANAAGEGEAGRRLYNLLVTTGWKARLLHASPGTTVLTRLRSSGNRLGWDTRSCGSARLAGGCRWGGCRKQLVLCTQHRPHLQNEMLSRSSWAHCPIRGLQPGGRGSVPGPTTSGPWASIVTSTLCCSAGGGWLHLQLLAPGSSEPCRLGCKPGRAATPNGGSRKENTDKAWFNTTSACTSGLAARPGTGFVLTKGSGSSAWDERGPRGESLVLHVQGGGQTGVAWGWGRLRAASWVLGCGPAQCPQGDGLAAPRVLGKAAPGRTAGSGRRWGCRGVLPMHSQLGWREKSRGSAAELGAGCPQPPPLHPACELHPAGLEITRVWIAPLIKTCVKWHVARQAFAQAPYPHTEGKHPAQPSASGRAGPRAGTTAPGSRSALTVAPCSSPPASVLPATQGT